MQIRLAALDLDGTLLDANRQPHPDSVSAARRAQERGIIVCLASGRMAQSMRCIKEQLGIRGPMVSCNGAFVLDADDNEIIHASVRDDVRDHIWAYADAHKIQLNLYCRDRVFIRHEGAIGSIYRKRLGSANLENGMNLRPSDVQPTKMLLLDRGEVILRLWREFGEMLKPDQVSLTISEPEYLEFLPPGVNKGSGLAALAAGLGIERSSIAAIGDYFNDIEMLEYAGFAGAVANAAPEVIQCADRVFLSNIEGGAGQFLDSLV